MISRSLAKIIPKKIRKGFVTVIYGARRTGKTVLLRQIWQQFPDEKALFFNGDTQETREALSTSSETKISRLIKDRSLIFIDEAQRIENIGLALKIMIDKFPEKKIFVTGSSSLDLSRGVRENLTGRNLSFLLFPLSTQELSQGLEDYKTPSLLEDQLIFGAYPYLQHLTDKSQKQRYLMSIVEDYLFKDVLRLERIENPEIFQKLAILLAFQVGSEVSLNHLSDELGVSVKTVSRYLNLLEKSFVIFRVGAYSGNLRKEVVKNKKYFFFDLGIRNALTNQFLPLDSRTDQGPLWENFLFVERMKKQEYFSEIPANYFFWRDYQQAEVDMIEVVGDKKRSFEFKWGKSKRKYKTPKSFLENYGLKAKVIDRENYLDFVK